MISLQVVDSEFAMNDGDVQAQQREVQRLLGRCLLRLQQYERLMKAIAAHHDISGPAHALESIRAARVDDAFTKTLGTLVGRLFGSCVVTEGADTAADDTASEPVDTIHFAMRMQLSLSAEDYARTQSDLKELVLLRNSLVHHFIDQHDLWSTDGCLTARDALVVAYARIDQHFEHVVAAVSLRRRCSPTRLPAARCTADASPSTPQRARWDRPRRPSASLFGVDHTPAPAIVLSRANLGAQGGLDFLSVGRPGTGAGGARQRIAAGRRGLARLAAAV